MTDVGFLSGGVLTGVIGKAYFSIVPSVVYDNCPYSAIESLILGTPVLGARIGGIPELIQDGKTGELFSSGDSDDLKRKIRNLWDNREKVESYRENCKSVRFDTVDEYTEKMMKIYAVQQIEEVK